jgi:hypothetical protein
MHKFGPKRQFNPMGFREALSNPQAYRQESLLPPTVRSSPR